MANKDKEGEGFMNVSRRDFLKVSATAAAVGGGWGLGYNAATALAYEQNANGLGTNAYTIKTTTCPYCSASCGQRVVKDIRVGSPTEGQVIDIYGDFESPMNSGGLCAKGAGTFQLVTNSRRIGAWDGTHPENAVFAARAETNDGVAGSADDFRNGVAYRRAGNDPWTRVGMDYALGDIAVKMKNARDANGVFTEANGWNSKQVAFFGSSHMNNEENNVYRKLIANFGTNNTEHQARI